METVVSIAKKVRDASNKFEENNSELKRRYLIKNIYTFNFLVSKIDVSCGSFGTGYPFYALKPDLTGKLPVIGEQIRYNNELSYNASQSKSKIWGCKGCLTRNYDRMPDLKKMCKPCPNVDDGVKPRKVLNRLPDIDMWMVCKDGQLEEASRALSVLFDKFGMHTSDVDPVQTIADMQEIADDLERGVMPKKFLPIDAHIIEYSTLKELIEKVPFELELASKNGEVPYWPIHPLSYRKTWQYDDTAYNFVHDYLSTLTEFNFDETLKQLLQSTRSSIAKSYSVDELYRFLIETGPDSVKRRHETKELQERFKDRIEAWNSVPTVNKKDKGEDDEEWEV